MVMHLIVYQMSAGSSPVVSAVIEAKRFGVSL